ncbi:uncharacterized protein LOC132939758 [Metopolophium dirhodum]|uniref:uncharacterized protein LOC132939758 n=1 Tax=Metopolophium dirhodum TaxID=44670 RepID=UPI0029901934|nr:uncharacterized protein LOC132939758 [Metopolophium dirhodum]
MVKRCVLCRVVDNIDDVSVHRFPIAVHRRIEWVAFVVDQGFPVNQTSQLCSRHFVPSVDYAVGNAQRRRRPSVAHDSAFFGCVWVSGVFPSRPESAALDTRAGSFVLLAGRPESAALAVSFSSCPAMP